MNFFQPPPHQIIFGPLAIGQTLLLILTTWRFAGFARPGPAWSLPGPTGPGLPGPSFNLPGPRAGLTTGPAIGPVIFLPDFGAIGRPGATTLALDPPTLRLTLADPPGPPTRGVRATLTRGVRATFTRGVRATFTRGVLC